MNYCRTECIMDGILSRRWIQTGWLSGLRRRAEVVKSCRVDELDTEVQGRGERCVQCDRLSLFNFDNNYLIKMDFFFWHSQPNGFLTFPSFSSSIMRKLFRYVSYFNYSWILKCILPYNLNSSRSDSLPSLLLLQKKWHALPILTLIKNCFLILDVTDIWVEVRTLWTDGYRCSRMAYLDVINNKSRDLDLKKQLLFAFYSEVHLQVCQILSWFLCPTFDLVYVLLYRIITFTKLKKKNQTTCHKNKKRQML